VRAVGVRAAVGVRIIIDGRLCGLAVGSVQPGPMPADTEVRIGRFAELIATAVVAGYRDDQKRQLLAEGSRRSNPIDSLLEGRAFDEWSLREVAGQLRLPINGPFVVIAAHVPAMDALSSGQLSLMKAAAITEFIVMWTRRRSPSCWRLPVAHSSTPTA
jgi:hypothetical protein